MAKAINGIGDESAQTNGLLAVMGRGLAPAVGSGSVTVTFQLE